MRRLPFDWIPKAIRINVVAHAFSKARILKGKDPWETGDGLVARQPFSPRWT